MRTSAPWSRRAVWRTPRSSFLMTTAGCWWCARTTPCPSFGWSRPAWPPATCLCACAMRRRWFASSRALPAGRASLPSWAMSLSARAVVKRTRKSWASRFHRSKRLVWTIGASCAAAFVLSKRCSPLQTTPRFPATRSSWCMPTTLSTWMTALPQAASRRAWRAPCARSLASTVAWTRSIAWMSCWQMPVRTSARPRSCVRSTRACCRKRRTGTS